MKSSRQVRWLYDELPGLTAKGVLDEAAAARLREHYGDASRLSGSRIAITVFTILGSLLVGTGIILLLAHNWEHLTRPMRAVLSFLPLVAAQAVALFVLRKPAAPRGQLEGAALFLALTVAASIALVGQTYHIHGDLGGFLLVWGLLILPVMYLFRSTSVYILYLACVTGWCGFMRYEERQTLHYWALFLAALPHFAGEARRSRFSVSTVISGLGLSVAILFGAGIRLDWDWEGLWILQYSSIFAALYLAGRYWFGDGPAAAQRPLENAGVAGIAVLSFILTFEDAWNDIFHHRGIGTLAGDHLLSRLGGTFLEIIVFLAAAIILGLLLVKRRKLSALALGAFPVPALIGYTLAAYDWALVSAVLFNAYSFGAGLYFLISGIRAGRLGAANFGLIWMVAIFVARFLDLDLSFVTRGIVFILLGAGFLVTNVILGRRIRRELP